MKNDNTKLLYHFLTFIYQSYCEQLSTGSFTTFYQLYGCSSIVDKHI